MSADFEQDTRLDRDRDEDRYTEVDEDALYDRRRDAAREAASLRAMADGMDRVMAALTPARLYAVGMAGEVDELAGRHDLTVARVTQGRMCDCSDGVHADLPPGVASRDWYWSPDLAQVEACRVFYSGDAHPVYRDVTVLTGPTRTEVA